MEDDMKTTVDNITTANVKYSVTLNSNGNVFSQTMHFEAGADVPDFLGADKVFKNLAKYTYGWGELWNEKLKRLNK